MLDMPDTPSITSTSPSSARLCASNSAILLRLALAPASASTRWAILRTVSAGPQMTWPGMVGLSIEAPTTPAGMPSSSITSEMMPEQSPSARKRSTAPDGGFGVDCIRMRSAAMRPVSFLSTMIMFLNRAASSALRTTAASRSVSSFRKARNSAGVATPRPPAMRSRRSDQRPSALAITCSQRWFSSSYNSPDMALRANGDGTPAMFQRHGKTFCSVHHFASWPT